MALRRFALIVLIGFFPCSNAAVAADYVAAVDVSERKTVADVSLGVAGLSKSVTVGGKQWRVRRAKKPTGSLVLIRNETGVPLITPFAGGSGREAVRDRVAAGGTVVRRCEAAEPANPWPSQASRARESSTRK